MAVCETQTAGFVPQHKYYFLKLKSLIFPTSATLSTFGTFTTSFKLSQQQTKTLTLPADESSREKKVF